MKPHIKYLLELEESSDANFRFDRINDNTIVISASGYIHQELMTAEECLLKLGCRYDFSRDNTLQHFDKVCGRTFTHMKEPK